MPKEELFRVITAREKDGDNRRFCTECGNLNEDGECLAAKRKEIVTASEKYTPILDLPRRCEAFQPLPGDPDQRHGRDKWGYLRNFG